MKTKRYKAFESLVISAAHELLINYNSEDTPTSLNDLQRKIAKMATADKNRDAGWHDMSEYVPPEELWKEDFACMFNGKIEYSCNYGYMRDTAGVIEAWPCWYTIDMHHYCEIVKQENAKVKLLKDMKI